MRSFICTSVQRSALKLSALTKNILNCDHINLFNSFNSKILFWSSFSFSFDSFAQFTLVTHCTMWWQYNVILMNTRNKNVQRWTIITDNRNSAVHNNKKTTTNQLPTHLLACSGFFTLFTAFFFVFVFIFV